MAGQLPVLSGGEVRKVFEKAGWEYVRQRGSHLVMVKEGHIATLSVPNHNTVAKGTLRSLIRASGLTVEQFVELV